MIDTELAILKTVVDTTAVLASEGDLDEALFCLVSRLGWAGRACAAGRPRTEQLARRYARRWLAHRRALRQRRQAEGLELAVAAEASR